MKKFLLGTCLGMFTLVGVTILPNYANADTSTDPAAVPTQVTNANARWGANAGGANMITDNKDKQTGSSLLTTIQNTIKWILGFLATIAVVICLYGGFLMMTAAGDEKKYQQGITVLKYAAIGLAIIALSWIIVSAVFWFVNLNAESGTMGDGAST